MRRPVLHPALLALAALLSLPLGLPAFAAPSVSNPSTPNPATPAPAGELTTLLSGLQSTTESERTAALSALEKRAKQGFTAQEVSQIIEAAGKRYIEPKAPFDPIEARLLNMLERSVRDSHLPALTALYPQLSATPRAYLLKLLGEVGTTAATQAYIDLLRRYGWVTERFAEGMISRAFEQHTNDADLLLPAMLDGSIKGLPPTTRERVLLAYAQNAPLAQDVLTRARALEIPQAAKLLKQLQGQQRTTGIAWRFEEVYNAIREDAGLVFDLLGYLGNDASLVKILQQAQSLRDPLPAVFAVTSLVRLGAQPDTAALQAVAADPETRQIIFSALKSLDKLALYPASELTQAKLAESEMVRWLVYPTELARAPDHIELMLVAPAPAEAGQGPMVYYVFRFRTDPPHWAAEKGWIAGIAGPYPKDESPLRTTGGSDTFSEFKTWDEFLREMRKP